MLGAGEEAARKQRGSSQEGLQMGALIKCQFAAIEWLLYLPPLQLVRIKGDAMHIRARTLMRAPGPSPGAIL